MSVTITTHLNFRGNARDALAFYHSIFGGQLVALSYGDAGIVTEAGEADQIIWGQVVCDNGFRVMAFDVPSHTAWSAGEIPFFVSARVSDVDDIFGYWEKLGDRGTIVQPLAPSAWSKMYGMVKDRFGVSWILDVAPDAVAS